LSKKETRKGPAIVQLTRVKDKLNGSATSLGGKPSARKSGVGGDSEIKKGFEEKGTNHSPSGRKCFTLRKKDGVERRKDQTPQPSPLLKKGMRGKITENSHLKIPIPLFLKEREWEGDMASFRLLRFFLEK